jgi:hypothetical protein
LVAHEAVVLKQSDKDETAQQQVSTPEVLSAVLSALQHIRLIGHESSDETPKKIQRQEVASDVRRKKRDSEDRFDPFAERTVAH